MPFIELIVSIFLVMAVHVLSFALAARIFRIQVLGISLGYGWKLFSVGLITIRLIPLGGFTKLLDTRDEERQYADPKQAFNHQSMWVQLLVVLSGLVILILVASLVLGDQVVPLLTSGMQQWILAAILPLSKAQEYLQQIMQFIGDASFIEILAVTAVKMTAMNLLPFPNLNGGQALLILARGGKPHAVWEDQVTKWLYWPVVLMYLSLMIALGYFVIKL